MTILVSGFEPFDGAATNPSWDAADALARRWAERTDAPPLVAVRLPVTFDGAWPALRAAIAEHSPDVVVAVGLAGGTDRVRLERLAVNLVDARIADNAGSRPVDQPVVAGGPAAYWTGLPVRSALAAIDAREIPATLSTTAGTFVCNALFYALMDRVADDGTAAGFVHVPAADATGLALDAIVDALETLVDVATGNISGDALPEPVTGTLD